jgi:ribosome-binding protein aMBF1 (putative translation factor)
VHPEDRKLGEAGEFKDIALLSKVAATTKEPPMPEIQLTSLREAASTLLNAAPAGAVIAALRALLGSWETQELATTPTQIAAVPNPVPAPTGSTPSALVAQQYSDDVRAWESLRLRVRSARAAKGLTNAQLADELGMGRTSVEGALQTRRVPGLTMRTRLETWLGTTEADAAPEVAAEAPTFQPNGSGATNGTSAHTGNGADHHSEAA